MGIKEDYSIIKIENLRCFAHHGVYKKETEEGQNFFVNCTLYQDIREAAYEDDIDKSTNYGTVCYFIDNWMRRNTCKLIETAAERLAEAILMDFPLVESVELEIQKPEAPIQLDFGSVSVKIRRGWHTAFLGLGSNMGNREEYIRDALGLLEKRGNIKVLNMSNLTETEPYGYTEQDKFINAAAKIKTLLEPHKLLQYINEIEKKEGRERTIHWGPRTLDIDILFYDDMIYSDDTLIIPHIDMENREFVLEPLKEIAPNHRHPILQKTVTDMLNDLRSRGNA